MFSARNTPACTQQAYCDPSIRAYQSDFSLSDSQALHSSRAWSSMIGSDRWPRSRRVRANSPSLTALMQKCEGDG